MVASSEMHRNNIFYKMENTFNAHFVDMLVTLFACMLCLMEILLLVAAGAIPFVNALAHRDFYVRMKRIRSFNIAQSLPSLIFLCQTYCTAIFCCGKLSIYKNRYKIIGINFLCA